jgi:asparagine synthetase B (glutamine-hydrolysing)
LLALAQQIPRVYCEPFADDSQLPTMALARLARERVTVCLSGDGGDELFHGYGYEKTLMRWRQIQQDIPWMSYLDLRTYLPDDILVKVDRAAMAFGSETRIPLLDYRIVEYAARVPAEIKRRAGRSKWPLRAILERSVPAELTERPIWLNGQPGAHSGDGQ